MARLKKTKAVTPTAAPIVTAASFRAPEPAPEHKRVTEWREFKQGDDVIVRMSGKPAKRGTRWRFNYHVTSPSGAEYVDVTEYKVGYPTGLWRSFPLESIELKHAPKKKSKETAQ